MSYIFFLIQPFVSIALSNQMFVCACLTKCVAAAIVNDCVDEKWGGGTSIYILGFLCVQGLLGL